MFKDLFSGHAADYKRFRPTYPDDLFQFLAEQASVYQAAWDCGTGNGQGAVGLSPYFADVYATDPSEQQLQQAFKTDNIHYQVATAEDSGLTKNSVSLVTVFQALHWFDLPRFFQEVRRVLMPGGVLAVVGYHTALTGIAEIDQVYSQFCFDYLWQKNCWAMERDILNNNYDTVQFPFKPIKTPDFSIKMQWTYQDYLAYLNTWSAVKTYEKKFHQNPVDGFVEPKIKDHWPHKDKVREVIFPLILRVGVIESCDGM